MNDCEFCSKWVCPIEEASSIPKKNKEASIHQNVLLYYVPLRIHLVRCNSYYNEIFIHV